MLSHPRAAAADQHARRRSVDVRPAHLVTGAALALGAALTLAACGGSSSAASGAAVATTPSTGRTSSSAAAGPGGGGGAGRGPAASGEIAAVTGTTLQVQSQQSGQVAVTWTSSTKFTQQVTLAASSIKAGDCVTAIAASGTSAGANTFSAQTVSVTSATNGSCQGGFAGGGGGFGGGARPSGFPSDGNFPSGARPSGFPSGAFASGAAGDRSGAGRSAIAIGSVVSLSGSTIVVAARDFTSGTGSSGSATTTTTNKTVTLTAKTKITGERSATSTAVKVGRCATARGSADSSGAVHATAISITDPVDGSCVGFGGFGGRPGGSGA